jgi:bacillithiol synthase
LLGRMPVMVSRSGFTLLDARTAKLMDRYGLNLPSFFHGEDGVRDLVARRLVPAALTQEFGEVRETVSRAVERLRHDLAAFDSTLASAANKSLAKILYQLSKIERKTARETLHRNARAAADASYMSGLIFPDKHLQERYYSILPFLAQHGVSELMDTLYQHVRLECPDHQVLVV